MAEYRPISGARARLYFNSTTPAGWATGVNASESIQLQRVDVLGDIDSQEIEAVGRSVTMTADFVRILGESLQKLGFWPSGGTADIINFPEMTAEIYDEVGENIIYRLVGVKCETRNWRFDRSGLMTVNATFQARKMLDEQG